MYVRRIRSNNQRWNLAFQRFNHYVSSGYRTYSPIQTSTVTHIPSDCISLGSVIGRALLDTSKSVQTASQRGNIRLLRSLPATHLRYFSSKGDGRDASEDKHVHTRDSGSSDKGTVRQEKGGEDARHCDAHAQLGDQEQKEWLRNEKLSIESKKKESPFLSKRERFKNEFSRRVVPWEKIALSWDTFPYYIHEHTKNVLMECVASHLKHKKVTVAYGGRLSSSSGRILLQSIPGTELYRERLVRTLARDLKVPLLVLDSSILAPYDFGEDCSSESESDVESGEECTSDSEMEDANDASNEEEWTSSAETKSEASEEDVDVEASVEALEKLIPFNLDDFEKRVSGELESSSESTSEAVDQSEKTQRPFRKGDRVKYTGPSGVVKADNRSMSSGQRGEVYEVNGDQIAVIFDVIEKQTTEEEKDEKPKSQDVKPSIYWIPANEIEHDLDAQAEDCYIAMEALCEVLKSAQPIIVYFPDSSLWLSRAVSKANRKEFVHKVQEMFDQLSGPVVLICGRNKVETGSKEKEKFTMILPNLGRLAKLPLSLKRLTEGLRATKRSVDDDIHKLFSNVMSIHPPKEEDLLSTFNKQIEEDRRIVIARSNLNELYKVLEEHELSCIDLLHVNTAGVILTKQKAEKVIGWAKNHYLYTCLQPSIKGDRLYLPRESLETAILRLKEQETMSKKPSQNLKNLAKDEYENNFVSAVVPPGEIGVKFDDIGALEEVKKALNELVILPMRRPELFSRGNLLRPCKGILLFGPPGTGKTLVAKALATEAGANFISITGSTLTSKWFGDAEKLTKALFSFASKLAPVIIFVDEVKPPVHVMPLFLIMLKHRYHKLLVFVSPS
ncbi:katanin p60 atpase-containing subunit a1 [Nicotiana attenuata]|uniref:Katanin p60 atpase-containing subunit a1 n=1 Tax=Nicotiana attenuata TaxID=49451 RepID=A0A314L6U0_NICAT|nr:katanin p60 atpase-containing subunit a1 [Nicotiana attenuata]